ncbi:MAG: tol-pal system protein YbgF [Thermodesulfobacteriota bacterium]
MKVIYLIAVVIVLPLYLASCIATQDDVGGLYARQNRLEAKVDKLSKEVNVVAGKGYSSNSDNREVSNQVFQLESKVFDLEQQITKMEYQIQLLEENLTSVEVSTLKYRPVPTQQRPRPSQVEAESATILEPEIKEPTLFDIGYKNFNNGNYAQSRQNFRAFLREDPKAKQAPDATFWIADSYYKEGLYEESILEYQRLIDVYPRDPRVPLAYLKQGMGLMKLNKDEEAKLFFQTLIDKYPGSPEADEAEKKISRLELNS